MTIGSILVCSATIRFIMKSIASLIDRFNAFIGRSTSWLAGLLVVVIIVDVFLRYAFSITSAASFEFEWHLFAALFLLSAGWALQEDRHVRVDVFYQRFSEKKKSWINIMGSLILLLPFCVVGVIEGFQLAQNAFILGETSPDPGGLPARYIIKSTIPLGFLFLGLQGISIILRNTYTLINGQKIRRE